jgi:beta-glucanase (GH16 family)
MSTKRLIIVLLTLIFFIFSPTVKAQQGFDMIFSDEFSGNSLDNNKWYSCFWWTSSQYSNMCTIERSSDPELQLYTQNNISVSNGNLRLRAERLSQPIRWCGNYCRDYDYTSGLVMTGGNKYYGYDQYPIGLAFRYGYAEARIKVPQGAGLWPAFWMLPVNLSNNSYSSLPEIDITEILGGTPNIHRMHYHYSGGSAGQNWTSPNPLSSDYHIYAIEWRDNELYWCLDGVKRWEFTGSNVSDDNMYLILNMAVGGWAGSPSGTSFPKDMFVDYVRVYKKDFGLPVCSRPSDDITPTLPPQPTPTSIPPTNTPRPPTSTPTNTPAQTIPGDANGDRNVDMEDYTIWLNNYLQSRSGSSYGDFNGNGVVNGVDYSIWLNNYGT